MEIVPEESVESTEAVDGVHLKLLAGGEEANVQHFVVEPGETVPAHDHPHEQLGYVLSGTLTFLVDGEEHPVSEGESYRLAGGEEHAAENRGDVPVVGLDVFAPPRSNPDWQD
jgi:quercetin dioxygenase-like cupin family protein